MAISHTCPCLTSVIVSSPIHFLKEVVPLGRRGRASPVVGRHSGSFHSSGRREGAGQPPRCPARASAKLA